MIKRSASSFFAPSMVSAFLVVALAAATGCAADAEPSDDQATSAANEATEATGTSSSELRIRFSAEGDSCTVRTNPDGTTVPGTVKGLECCATANPTDCVIILKPFPTSFSMR
ncbi:MAG: hypothetical protein JST00_25090 [Deltaproteobacteria bacterium]|nr:hypothetical protein [Deltaproteobacteria bacterium]